MVQSIEKTTSTVQEITRSQQRALGALTDNFVSFQRRNAEVGRGFAELLKLQESNARAAQDLFTSGVRFAELQGRNVRFAQEWVNYGVNYWRDQAQSNAQAAEVVAQSAAEQQESVRKLAEQWASTYEGFFSSWNSYAQEGLKNAQQVTQRVAEQNVQVAERVAEQGLQATEQSARQGLRLAEETTEQTERVAKQADPNHLPIEDYDELNVSEVTRKLDGLSAEELKKVEAYEKRNKNRETVIGQIQRKIKAAS